LALRRKIDDRQGISSSLNNLGCVALFQGDLDASRAYYEESAKLRREVGDRHGLSATLGNLACVVMDQGDLQSAHAYLNECLEIITEIADRNGVAYCLEAFAQLATKEGDFARAVILWSVVEVLRTQSNSPRPQNEADQYEMDVADVKDRLGAEAFTKAWEKGRSMTEQQAVNFALDRPR
jgi:tetratricopeptide (TPR) repeat protein